MENNTTVTTRPVGTGLRIEVTHHLPHRPHRIEAYLLRTGTAYPRLIETIDLLSGRPTWRRV
jgi:hypothetical protein